MVRILAIHAHPDDIETLAAGTLAHLSRAGCDILIATLTAGECGSRDLTAEETARALRRSSPSRGDDRGGLRLRGRARPRRLQ
jgi:LmbE family N-acetylglucosaminyl deacetylase